MSKDNQTQTKHMYVKYANRLQNKTQNACMYVCMYVLTLVTAAIIG